MAQPTQLAQLLMQAIGGAQAPPPDGLPLLQQGRTRGLSPPAQPGILAGSEGDYGEYFDDPLLNVNRSRFPPGMLESLGLGAARIK